MLRVVKPWVGSCWRDSNTHLVEVVDRRVGAARVHVLLFSHVVNRGHVGVVQRTELVPSEREAARDSDGPNGILRVVSVVSKGLYSSVGVHHKQHNVPIGRRPGRSRIRPRTIAVGLKQKLGSAEHLRSRSKTAATYNSLAGQLLLEPHAVDDGHHTLNLVVRHAL